MSYPQCILCRAFCRADMNYCLPQCRGRQTGHAHFFCQACWDHTLSRVKCELASCTGCHIGAPTYRTPESQIPVFQEGAAEDYDLEMQD